MENRITIPRLNFSIEISKTRKKIEVRFLANLNSKQPGYRFQHGVTHFSAQFYSLLISILIKMGFLMKFDFV